MTGAPRSRPDGMGAAPRCAARGENTRSDKGKLVCDDPRLDQWELALKAARDEHRDSSAADDSSRVRAAVDRGSLIGVLHAHGRLGRAASGSTPVVEVSNSSQFCSASLVPVWFETA